MPRAATAGSIRPCCATGTCWANCTNGTIWCRSGRRRNCATGPSAAGGEKRAQKLARLHLVDPAVDLGRVVAGRLAENARPVLDPATLGIGGAEIQAA